MRRHALALALLSAPAVASADPPRARLAWVRGDGAEGCPDTDALRTALSARAGRDVVGEGAALSLEAVVSRAAPDAPWEARVFVRDGAGALLAERRLRMGGSCAELVEAVALALAVAVDDAPVVDAPPPPPPPPPSSAPPVVAAPPRVAPPRRWRFAARVQGGVAVGVVSNVSAVVGLRVEVRPPGWPRLYAGASWVAGAERASSPGAVSTSVAGGALGVCPLAARAGDFDLSLCAGAFAGTLTAEGSGFSFNRSVVRPYLALEASAHARWNLSRRVDLSVAAEVLVPLVRDTAAVEGVGAVFEAPAAGLRGVAGLGFHFE